MSLKHHLAHTPLRLVALALGVSAVMTVQVAVASGLLGNGTPLAVFAAAALLLVYLTGAVLAVFNANATTPGQTNETSRLAAALAGLGMALVAGIEVSHAAAKLPAGLYLGVALVGEALATYALATLALGCLKLSGSWQQRPPLVAAGFVLAVAAAAFMGESFIAVTSVPTTLGLLRDLSLAVMLVVVACAVAFVPSLRLDRKSRYNALRLRLPGADPSARIERLTLMGLAAGAMIGVVLQVVVRATSLDANVLSLVAAFCPAWFGTLFATWIELQRHASEQRQGQATARLATQSARRFLKRYLNEKEAWAATVGIRTTNFHIDHDPSGQLSVELPASVNQIRAEEIQRCVTEVLGAMHLHSQVVGQRLFGALDPEHAMRPCVDTLKMFACLYLDAGPLVERRIKGLLALLPIVDPGLARILKPKDIGSLIRRNLWFFHYDFGWIDQHLIHTPRHTRYDVRIAALSSRIRQSMMEYLDKTGGFGNFVWIGPEARDRLLQEAPILSNIIEPCPISDAEDVRAKGQKDELLMFIIKFEQLIPRLQRYFDLDSMRRSLMDFEPSPESLRLQNLLGLQIGKAADPAQVIDAMASITTVPWRGFKEKDAALQLVMQAHTKLSELITPGQSLVEAAAKNTKAQAMHDRLLDAVRLIGYPSQILHNAQVSKLALRDVKTLMDVAGDDRHGRFEEAWLLMATADYQRYKPEQRLQLLKFLQQLGSKPRLTRERLVQMKCVDALAGLGRVATEAELTAVATAIDQTFLWMARQGIDPDIACLLLDTYLFLTMHQHRAITLGANAIQAIDGYIAHVEKELGANHPRLVSLMSRWREFRTPRAA